MTALEETPGAAGSPPVIRMEPASGWRSLELKEAWAGRELLTFFVWRDIKVRYKQTAFGALWAVVQPFMTVVVFSVFFGKLAKVPSDGVPYPLFSAAALVPWMYFSNALNQASLSLVATPDLISKIYFPRILIPTAAVGAGLVDFAIAFVVLIGLALAYGVVPGPEILAVIPLLALTVITALGVGYWLAALNVQYRDVRYALPFLLQFWLFATPVAYSASLLSEPWQTLYALNPMTGVVEGFRWAVAGTDTAPGLMVAVSAVAALILLVTGTIYFKRMEERFADVI